MADEIRLHVAGLRVLPFRERAHGDVLLHRGNGPPTHALSSDRRAGRPQHPIEGRRTGGQHARPYRHVQREVAVTLKRRDEQREERLESFPADPVGGLPQQDERLTHGFIVDRKTRSPPQPAGDRRRIEQADDVLAVVARDGDEFIEDAELLVLQTRSIPLPNRLQ